KRSEFDIQTSNSPFHRKSSERAKYLARTLSPTKSPYQNGNRTRRKPQFKGTRASYVRAGIWRTKKGGNGPHHSKLNHILGEFQQSREERGKRLLLTIFILFLVCSSRNPEIQENLKSFHRKTHRSSAKQPLTVALRFQTV
ncbi:hypothetical protein A2U01_0014874, partial [Trifolium medium]|nr:hypothetical protein [Trifolium medium]